MCKRYSGENLQAQNLSYSSSSLLQIISSAAKFLSYSTQWIKALFVINNGGFNVYHIQHQFSKSNGGGAVEKHIGRILAYKYARRVEFLPEDSTAGGKADLQFDGQKWEVKSIIKAKSDDTIRKAIRDAAKADNVIFYWGTKTNQLAALKKATTREIGYSQKMGRAMPNIYYINASNEIRSLYIKSSEPPKKETPT